MKALITFGVLCLCATSPAYPEHAFPTKSVRVVVGYSAGGPADAIVRHLAAKVAEKLGQPVVVENRAGAAGSIAAVTVAKSVPDGHTLLYASSDFVIFPALHTDALYDPVKDFAPVTGLNRRSLVLVANPSLGVKSFQELVALARAKPGQLNYGSSGVGSFEHLTAEIFRKLAAIDLIHVPYKGSASAILELVAGRIQLGFEVTVSIAGHIQSGKLSPLVTTGRKRFKSLPDVPTVYEVGMPGLDTGVWSAILAPVGTPKDVIARLNAVFAEVRNTRDTIDNPIFVDSESFTGTSEALAAHLKSESARYSRIIKEAQIKVD